MAIILAVKLIAQIGSVSSQMKVWLAVSPIVLVLALRPVGSRFAKTSHATLFLLTGAAIGITIGGAISQSPSTSLLELSWLFIAVPIAIIHYSPSPDDVYLS